ncbi:ABC transporter substrate-binding protein [Sulfitobacter aestuarii]|uniref:ABC transporter substrate-binding protein n=1 Tax=Sulfitobacter aestuarii TaxID=2161676 RepID=A0ABW5U1T2_9RHOB
MTIKTNRRSLLLGAGALGATGLLGLSGQPLRAQNAPQKGGTFRMAIADFDSGETLDPQVHETKFMTLLQWQLRNNLIEVGPGGVLVPELATSWEGSEDSLTWVFKLREGVEFHNGKSMSADDVVFSLNLHRGDDTVSQVKALTQQIADVKASAPHEVTVTLHAPNATFPSLMTVINLLVVPADDMNFDAGIGTGGYILESYEPGVKARVTRNPNYWKEGRGHFEAVETLAIRDVNARTTALQTGQVDAMNFVDPTTARLMQMMPGVDLVQTQGKVHYAFSIDTTAGVYTDNDVRRAMKLAINRQEIVDKVLGGFGSIANDQSISSAYPNYNPNLPQHEYDPDEARALMKKAGAENEVHRLHVSETPFAGAVDAAQLYSEHAAAAGITIEVAREPEDGYWSKVWGKVPFFAERWSGRANEDLMLSLAYSRESIGSWNSTHWDNDAFNKALTAARSERDDAKRRELLWECQALLSAKGGVVAPVWADYLDAKSEKVSTPEQVAGDWDMDGCRASERWWFNA